MAEDKSKRTESVPVSRQKSNLDETILNEPLATVKQKNVSPGQWARDGSPRIWVRQNTFTIKERGEKLVVDYDKGYGYFRMMFLSSKDDKIIEGAWCSNSSSSIKLRDFLCVYSDENNEILKVYREYK